MEQDKKTLIEILQSITRILTWIVSKSGLIDADLGALFQQELANVTTQINSAIANLKALETEEEPVYQKLKTYGLTGNPLKLKKAVGKMVFKEASDSFTETKDGPRILGFKLKRPMEWINSILGSLALVFPPLEVAKEYKENVELAVKERESEPEWGYKPIFDLS